MTIQIASDLGLAALLVATLIYGIMLHRRLGHLRADRDRLAAVVQELNEATARAVAGMEGLKAAADSSGRALQGIVDRARGTVDDLAFLVERGERAAGRLENATRPDALRGGGRPAPVAPADAIAAAPAGDSAPRKQEAAGERPVPSERQALLKVLEKMR